MTVLEQAKDSATMADQFSRTRLLIGSAALERLAASRVAVFGLGGVGGYVVEALARGGIGALDLIDNDIVDITNLNRQIIATHDTLGRSKVEVASERVRAINPECRVVTHECFYLPENADTFDFTVYDYVVDAVDTVTAKLQLAQAAQDADVPFISSMGTANKLDPSAFRVGDIYETSICPLARIMRKESRKRGLRGFKVVYSLEPPCGMRFNAGEDEPEPNSGRRSPTPGSVPYVPSVAGLLIASTVLGDLV